MTSEVRPVKAYWWTGIPNFGDRLAPLLLKRFAYLDCQHAPNGESEVVSVGSLLEYLPAGWSGYVVGSGILRESYPLKFDPSAAKILALRGPLTASRFTGTFALGDPGLLANELIEPQEKKYDLGILPHWKDKFLVEKFQTDKVSCKVISPRAEPLSVLRDIASCRALVTSSLHGIISADAIGGIPRQLEPCDALEVEGGLFKYHDYAASIHLPLELGKMQEPSRNWVNERRFEVFDAYRELSSLYGR